MTMSAILVLFLLVSLVNPTFSQRTYNRVLPKCQCAPTNWNPADLERIRTTLGQVEEWKGGMEKNMGNFADEMLAMINNVTLATTASIEKLFKSNGTGLNDMEEMMKQLMEMFNSTSAINPGLGGMQEIITMMNSNMNVTMMEMFEMKGVMEKMKYQVMNMQRTVTSQNAKIEALEKEVNSVKCRKPKLVLAGDNVLDGVTVKVSSSYGKNGSLEIPVESISVKSTEFWCASEGNTVEREEYIQVAFNKSLNLMGVVTRGRGAHNQWVATYRVDVWVETEVVGNEDGGNVGGMWKSIKDELDIDAKIFEGNVDVNGVKVNYFPRAYSISTIRFVPLTTPPLIGGGFSNKCTRLDFITCSAR